MAELIILLIGLAVSGILALLKLAFAIASISWLGCLIPLGIALVLICIINGIDIWD